MIDLWLNPFMAWWAKSLRAGAGVLGVAALLHGGALPARAALSDALAQKIRDAQEAASHKEIGRAISLYSEVITEGITDPSANVRTLLKRRAMLFEQINEPAAAEADLTTALHAEPKDTAAYADRGYFYMRVRRYDDALGDFVTGTQLDPKNPVFPFGAARAESAMEHFSRAIVFYDDSIALDPRNARYILARAEAKLRLGLYDKARIDYDAAISIGLTADGDRFFGFAGRGYLSLLDKNIEAAIADFDRALAINPSAVNVLTWRGYANELRGVAGLALRDYERAAALSPDMPVLRASIRRLRSK